MGYAVGYEDPTFFRRHFKRTTNMTPSAYRRKRAPIVAVEMTDRGGTGTMSDEFERRPYRLGAGEGRRLWPFGELMILTATAKETNGQVLIIEQHVPRHRQPPGRHVHAADDQAWFVISGTGGSSSATRRLWPGPGDFIHGPHGMPHAFSADSDDLHGLVMTTPAGLEGFFAESGVDALAAAHPPADLSQPADDPDVAARYGVTALGPEPRWTPAPTASTR